MRHCPGFGWIVSIAYHRKLSITLMAAIPKLPLQSLSTISYSVCVRWQKTTSILSEGPWATNHKQHYVSTSHIGVISIQMVLVNEISSNSCYGTNRRSDYVCMDTPAWFTDSSIWRLKTRHECLRNGVIIVRVCLSIYRDPLDARPYKRNTGIEREKSTERKEGKERNTKCGKERGEKSLDLSEQWENERRH